MERRPKRTRASRRAAAEASLLLAVVFLGSNPVSVKFAVSEVPPLALAAGRFTAAGLLLVGLLWLLEPGGFPSRRELPLLAGLGVAGVGINQAAFAVGVDWTTASHTAMVYATAPIWGMVLGAALGLERPTWRGVLGVMLALSGLGLVVLGGSAGSGDAGGPSVAGDVLITVAAACWGAYAVLSIPLLRGRKDDGGAGLSPLAVGAFSVLFGGISLLPLGIPGAVGMGAEWGSVSGPVWAAVAYSTLCVSAYGFAAWQAGVARVGANRVLVYQYLITLVGVTSGILLLGEQVKPFALVGVAALLCGVYLARR